MIIPGAEVVRTDVHNHDFLEEDSFDLALLEESFASSECIARNLSRRPVLAGGYPAMYLGAPWWFLDSPEMLRRFRETVTETAGFYNTAGFVDDTRAFCSIPVRHEVARRIDAGYLARLVAEERLPLAEAEETIVDLAYHIPKRIFKL